MKAEMIWQVDIHQVSAHQLVFIIGRCQQHFVAYLFSLGVGPLACLYGSKVFPTHVNPEWHRSALHSLDQTSWTLRFHVNSTKWGPNSLCETGHLSKLMVTKLTVCISRIVGRKGFMGAHAHGNFYSPRSPQPQKASGLRVVRCAERLNAASRAPQEQHRT